MTDEDKALVERLRDFVIAEDIDLAADRIEALSAENERMREALFQMKRIPNYIRKDDNRKEMLKIINAALGDTK